MKTNKLKATEPGRSSEPEPNTESTEIARKPHNSTHQKQKRSRSQPPSHPVRTPPTSSTASRRSQRSATSHLVLLLSRRCLSMVKYTTHSSLRHDIARFRLNFFNPSRSATLKCDVSLRCKAIPQTQPERPPPTHPKSRYSEFRQVKQR